MPSKIRGGNNDKHMADMHVPRVSSMAKPGGAAAFVPTDLTSLLVWAKADAGVFTDAGRTTAATNDGDTVKGWTDQSGSANHLSHAVGITLKLNIQNGRAILRGNGTNQGLDTASIAHNIGTGDFYVAMVVIPRGTGASKPFLKWGGADNGMWNHTPLALYDSAYKDFNTTPANGTAYILEMWRASGTAFAAVNGTQEANTPASAGSIANGTFAVANAGGLYHQIDVGEVIFCKHAQDATKRASTRAYLNGRWATY